MKPSTLRQQCDPRDLALMRVASYLETLAASPSNLATHLSEKAAIIRGAVFDDNYAAIFPEKSDGLP